MVLPVSRKRPKSKCKKSKAALVETALETVVLVLSRFLITEHLFYIIRVLKMSLREYSLITNKHKQELYDLILLYIQSI